MTNYFSPPPSLAGSEKDQLKQIRNYLFILSENLNEKMQQLETPQIQDEFETAQGSLEKYSTLKKAISKNNEELDKLKTAVQVIWENPSSTATFAAQTVSAALHDFELIIISYKQVNTAFYMRDVLIPSSLSGKAITASDNRYDGAVYSTRRSATCDFTADTVKFGAGYQNGKENSAIMIPYRIYGIKGVSK